MTRTACFLLAAAAEMPCRPAHRRVPGPEIALRRTGPFFRAGTVPNILMWMVRDAARRRRLASAGQQRPDAPGPSSIPNKEHDDRCHPNGFPKTPMPI